MFEGQALWFHSINSEALVDHIYDYVDRLLRENAVVPPGPPLGSSPIESGSC